MSQKGHLLSRNILPLMARHFGLDPMAKLFILWNVQYIKSKKHMAASEEGIQGFMVPIGSELKSMVCVH